MKTLAALKDLRRPAGKHAIQALRYDGACRGLARLGGNAAEPRLISASLHQHSALAAMAVVGLLCSAALVAAPRVVEESLPYTRPAN